ncbi:putative 2OG-Fe(II) oxygenase [Pseudomonas syringae]|uniref:putative 2OG-Fe(II) oxygenase n=1 Tax=Pseudomonas syringae TaxID=317 RepID=UPI00301AA394
MAGSPPPISLHGQVMQAKQFSPLPWTSQHSSLRSTAKITDLIEPDFEWRHNAWVNVNEAGHGNALHGHPGAFWSGVYWVDDGGRHDDVSIGGDLEFPDPRGMMPSVYNPTLRMRIDGCLTAGYSTTITPCTGTLVMFPSWLMHLVQSYKGKRPRVSIAFNFGV